MKTLKILVALIAIMYTTDATTELQPITPGDALPEFTGAPCSVSTDYEEGICVVANLKLRKPKWN